MIQKWVFFIVCSYTLLASAQSSLQQLDIQATLAVPFGQATRADSTASTITSFGFGVGFINPIIKNSSLRMGIYFRHLWLGNENRRFNFTDVNGIEYEMQSKVKGSMNPLHLMVRIDPMNYTKFPIIPYAGGIGGVRFFNTNSQVKIDYNDGSEPTITNNRKVSIASSYGYELGLHIRIAKDVLIDIRYERAFGGNAKYIDLSSVEIDDYGNVSYRRIRDRTDADMMPLGVTLFLEASP